MNSNVLPYAVLSENGGILKMLQTNEKGYRKSIENNRIWAVNPDTDRLLPVDDLGIVKGFSEKDGWYEVTVQSAADPASGLQTAAEKPVPGPDPASLNPAGSGSEIIERLFGVIEQRKKEMPEGSYTTHLFNSGMSKIKKKTGEEAVELLLAEDRSEIIYEASDLIYHMLVLLSAADINPEELFRELKRRE